MNRSYKSSISIIWDKALVFLEGTPVPFKRNGRFHYKIWNGIINN